MQPAPPAAVSSHRPAQNLLVELLGLRSEIVSQAAERLEKHRNRYPDGRFTPSACNLAHYLALRRYDLRALQDRLAEAGVSSLGRCEAHVLSSINQLIELVGHKRPATIDLPDSTLGVRSGQQLLADNTRRMFGPKPDHRDTHIMVTLPAAAALDYALVRNLVKAGMGCARINCAHDNPSLWERMIRHVRRAADETGRQCRIMMDLEGHKVRTGPLAAMPAIVHLRTHRDRYGRTVAPASVVFETDPRGYLTEVEADRTGYHHLRLPAALHSGLQSGDRLVFHDTRGKKRCFTILHRNRTGQWMAECWGNAYVSSETTLHWQRMDEGFQYRSLGTFRFASFPDESVDIRLHVGDELLLSARPVNGRAARPASSDKDEPARIACNHPDVVGRLRPGHAAWIDDGKIGGVVQSVDEQGALIRITHAKPKGSRLKADKGLNFPDTDLGLSGLSDRDRSHLDFVCRHADMIGFSFVETVADMEALMGELEARDANSVAIVANLPDLILGTIGRFRLGVMIARGDLAVELGGERLAEVQEEILWLCEASHTPAVWATQVLDSLAQKGVINRAELTDAAMAGRAECVMLNKGSYILDALRTLDDILSRIRAHQYKKFARFRALHW